MSSLNQILIDMSYPLIMINFYKMQFSYSRLILNCHTKNNPNPTSCIKYKLLLRGKCKQDLHYLQDVRALDDRIQLCNLHHDQQHFLHPGPFSTPTCNSWASCLYRSPRRVRNTLVWIHKLLPFVAAAWSCYWLMKYCELFDSTTAFPTKQLSICKVMPMLCTNLMMEVTWNHSFINFLNRFYPLPRVAWWLEPMPDHHSHAHSHLWAI